MPDFINSIYLWIESTFVAQPLLGLFLSGFLSATLLPGSSEISLYAALQLDTSELLIILVASIGNTLGGAVNYAIGVWLPNSALREKKGAKLENLINKYGYIILCFSWLPVIGDALCIAAGWMRMRFFPALICIFIGKTLRYIFLCIAITNTI